MSVIDVTSAPPPRRCAKCGDSDVLFVENRGSLGYSNAIPLSGVTICNFVKVDRYICMACGFCEEWITNPEDREALRRWYQPGSRRARINERRRRWRQYFANLKRRLFGNRPTDQSTQNKEPS